MKKTCLTEVVLLTKSYNLQDFKDWMKWHLEIIKFDHVHIFDNESSVDIKSVCDSYGDKASYEFIEGWPNQYALYNRYINNESPAWWVLPIDDDEFLYVSEKYKHNVNTMILTLQEKWPDMMKLSVRWRNMFPLEFTEVRTKSLIENATGWSNEACESLHDMWRQDNRYIKTFSKMTCKYHWGIHCDRKIDNSGHNPVAIDKPFDIVPYMCNGSKLSYKQASVNVYNTENDDVFLAHYQFKSNSEWKMKCTSRKSAASKTFDKNKPLVYEKLYDFKNKFKSCNYMIKLFCKINMEWVDYCITFIPKLEYEYRKRMGIDLNIESPTLFTEKLQYLKIYDSSHLKSFCTDKITIHDYCLEKTGLDLCIPIIKTYDSENEINLDELPNRFVIKCNHGCKMNIIVKDKSELDLQNTKSILNKWMAEDFSTHNGCELHYKNIPHKILIEEYKENTGHSDLTDYKFYCFNGIPIFCQVILDRHDGITVSHFKDNWEYAPEFDWIEYKSTPNISKPQTYDMMMYYSKILSKDFKLCRCDFYEIDNKLYLGELTFTPNSGYHHFVDKTIDKKLGDLLKI